MKDGDTNNEIGMPEGYSSVSVEFTKEEAQAIAEYLDLAGSIGRIQ